MLRFWGIQQNLSSVLRLWRNTARFVSVLTDITLVLSFWRIQQDLYSIPGFWRNTTKFFSPLTSVWYWVSDEYSRTCIPSQDFDGIQQSLSPRWRQFDTEFLPNTARLVFNAKVVTEYNKVCFPVDIEFLPNTARLVFNAKVVTEYSKVCLPVDIEFLPNTARLVFNAKVVTEYSKVFLPVVLRSVPCWVFEDYRQQDFYSTLDLWRNT